MHPITLCLALLAFHTCSLFTPVRDASLRADVCPAVDSRFQRCRVTHHGRELSYRLYVPPGSSPSHPLPLVVWFHGRGESGDNQRDQLRWLELIMPAENVAESLAAFVLAPQFPHGDAPWVARPYGINDNTASPNAAITDPLSDLDAMLADVLARQSVDMRRMSLAGISQGATAAWEYAQRHPGRFAALLSLGATGTRPLGAPTTAPAIWAFQSSADGPPLLARVQRRVEELRISGVAAYWTVVNSDDHNCWTVALRDHVAHHWLIAQQLSAHRIAAWHNAKRRSTAAPRLDNQGTNESPASHLATSGLAVSIASCLAGVLLVRLISRREQHNREPRPPRVSR